MFWLLDDASLCIPERGQQAMVAVCNLSFISGMQKSTHCMLESQVVLML